MKVLLISVAFIYLASTGIAQQVKATHVVDSSVYAMPIGKPKSVIMKFGRSLPFLITTQGDTLDTFSSSFQTVIHHYRNDTCIWIKETFPMDTKFIWQGTFNQIYKKRTENTWFDKWSNSDIVMSDDPDK